jgi:hypothetical protein
MPPVLVVIFWCWFAVSLFILVRRGTRRATGRSKRVDPRPPIVWPPLDEIDPVPADDPVGSPAESPRTMFTREPRVNRATNIAAALDGIRLPCDLAPLTGDAGDFERRAAFYTVGYPAAAVAPEIADELERIGMEFKALTDSTAIARRDDLQVRVAVHAVGPAVNGIADLTYPTAPEHSVVVEFELA